MTTIQDFRYYNFKQIINLIGIEFLVFLLAFCCSFLTCSHWFVNNYFNGFNSGEVFHIAVIGVGYSTLANTALYIVGLYKNHMNLHLSEQYLRSVAGMCILLFAVNNLAYWFKHFELGKYFWLFCIGLSLLMLIISRAIFIVFTRSKALKTKTVILGTGSKALQLKNYLENVPELQTEIVGYIHKPGDRERLNRDEIINISLNNKCNTNNMRSYCLENNINTIVVAVDDRRNNFPLEQLLECKQNGVNVVELMEFYEQELGRQQLDILDPSWVIYSNKSYQTKQQELNKSFFDTVLAFILIVLSLPIMLVVTILLKINSGLKNSVIIKKEMVGKHGKPYKQYQFNCYNQHHQFTLIGRMVLRLNLVDLPILLNIIKQDMSFVGPVAVDSKSSAEYSREIWYYRQRYAVKPGLISWGVANKLNNATILDNSELSEKNYLAREQLQYDLFYIKKRSCLFDIMLILYAVCASGRNYSSGHIKEKVLDSKKIISVA